MDNISSKEGKGFIRMLGKTLIDGVVQYQFNVVLYLNDSESNKKVKSNQIRDISWDLNSVIGNKLFLIFSGYIRCINCGKPTKKSFNQGSCYTCFTTLASNDICIVKPSLCHYHKGTCREPDWGRTNCFSKHTVYLSITSGGKVGITKENDPINRWIDQGATLAISILETESRMEAGIVEEFIARYIPDKSNWQKMVTSGMEGTDYDLKRERQKFLKAVQSQGLTYRKEYGEEVPIKIKESHKDEIKIQYPIQSYPKAKAIQIENTKPIGGTLIGIKGQYLLFDTGVLNIRNLQGYEVRWEKH